MRSPLQIVSVGALLVACTTVRPVQPAELSPPHAPTRVWVTGADRSTVVLDSAHVTGDTIVGLVSGRPRRLALSEATVLRVEELSEARTLALMALSVGGVIGMSVLAPSQEGGGCSISCASPPQGGANCSMSCASPRSTWCFGLGMC